MNRRDVLRLAPVPFWRRVVGAPPGADFERINAHPNFAVGTAARVRYFARADRDRARNFLARYQDRVRYATDFALRDAAPAAGARSLRAAHDRDWRFFATDEPMDYEGRPTRGLALADAILRKLFRDNARRWLPGLGA